MRPLVALVGLLVLLAGGPLAAAPPPSNLVAVPRNGRVETFELERALNPTYDGRNGLFSLTYVARRLSDGKRVAVKLLRPEARKQGWGDTFEKEVRVLSQVQGKHASIPKLYGLGQRLGPRPERALVMELVDGKSLPTGVPYDQALRWTAQVLGGVAALNDVGLSHRDLHLGNVLIGHDESPASVKLLDYGAARPALERYDGHSVTAKNGDAYQAAVLLMSLLGTRPGRGATQQQLIDAFPDVSATDAAGQPVRLRDVMRKALHPDRQQRHATGKELLAALRPFVDQLP
jgi:serine/threonine protein kinase